MKKVIIEARINEYNMRTVNPNVPWTVDEIVEEACKVREAGAAIMHFHARQLMVELLMILKSMQR